MSTSEHHGGAPQQSRSGPSRSGPSRSGTVIEELTLRVDPLERDAFLRRDAEVWTTFLESCEGFLGKEVWLPDDRPDAVVAVIRWQSHALWKAIGPELVEEIDQRMGDLCAEVISCRSHQVA